MWMNEVFGTDVYHLVAAFIIYSILGWFVESIYMSICNKRLTNRGFAKGPFCPIYGVGAVCGYMILHPLGRYPFLLYLAGAILATVFEYLTGRLMLLVFGELWWDYHNKPFNYQGIICLESTIAWGFYGLGIILFLHDRVIQWIDRIDSQTGVLICSIVLLLVVLDYIWRFFRIFDFTVQNFKNNQQNRFRRISASIRRFF